MAEKATYCVLVSVLLTSTVVSTQASSETYYVRPQSSGNDCPDPCYTLAEYQAMSQAGSLVERTVTQLTMILLPGVHLLSERNDLTISGLDNFKMESLENATAPAIMNMQAHMILQSINKIEFSGLTFTSYDVSQTRIGFLILPQSFQELTFHGCSLVHFFGHFLDIYRSNMGGTLIILNNTIADNTLPVFPLGTENRGSLFNIEEGPLLIFDGNLVTRNNVTQSTLLFTATRTTNISNSTFSENFGTNCFFPIISTWGTTIYLKGINVFTLNRHILWFVISSTLNVYGYAEFSSNIACGGPLTAMDHSHLQFFGDTLFFNNTALTFGGAMIFSASSFMNLAQDSNLLFSNNKALNHGGGIYVDERRNCLDTGTVHCFLQQSKNIDYNLTFYDNNANISGDDVYGGDLGTCVTNGERPADVLHSGTRIHSTPTLTSISSYPMQICVCDKTGILCCPSDGENLDNVTFEACPTAYDAGTIYRGERVTLNMLAVGQYFGVTSADVRAFNGNILEQFDSLTFGREVIGVIPIIESFESTCTSLTYTPSNTTVTASLISFFPDGVCSVSNALVIRVGLRDTCPPGFELSVDLGICDCENRLQLSGVTCEINGQKIEHTGNIWLGLSTHNDLIIHPSPCPFMYCITGSRVAFTLNNTDKQCSNNRSGILCGRCAEGLSVVLGGSSHCDECSNVYLGLIVPFALAGIGLLTLLLVLRLTVTHGTLSSLIFYANILQINRTVFLPQGGANVLTVFIAWLNLDLGIVTCFYDGMDAYGKTWLQFVFPFYIWVLCGLVIFSSSRSRRVTQLLGSNPMAVLATLFLLSYLKVLRTIIAVISGTDLEYEDGKQTVWQLDGNVPFASGKRLPLLIFALLVFIALFIPYTILLLFGHIFQSCSHLKIFSWAKSLRLKAFLDTYHAPYKAKHRYWTGLLLIFRIVLAIVNALTNVYYTAEAPKSFANLLSVQVVVFICLGWGWLARGVYSKWMLELLESSFLINLGLLSFATYHIQSYGRTNNIAGYISIAVALVTFAGIITYHIYAVLYFRFRSFIRTRINGLPIPLTESERGNAGNATVQSAPGPTINNRFAALRESLLEDESYSNM